MYMRRILLVLVTTAALGLSACSSMDSARHEYLMRGQVVEVSGKDAVVCVGAKDGAKAGQQLKAFKLQASSTASSPKTPVKWERTSVGVVRIVEVIDEHFARAQIVSGDVQVNNLVELEK